MTKLIPSIFAPKKTLSERDTQLILKSVCYSFSDASILITTQKKIVAVNASFEKLTGFTNADLDGKHIHYIYRNKPLKSTTAAFRKKIKSGKPYVTNTFHYNNRSGKKLQVQTIAQQIYISHDERYILFLLRDVKEQKKREKHLKLSEGEYRFLFEKNPYPMWIFDKKTMKFLAVNDAAVKHYGYTREEFLHMRLVDIRPHDELPKLFKRMEEISLRNGSGRSGVWRHQKKNGEILFAEVSYTDISFNRRRSTLIMANDITEKKLTEEAASALNKRIAHILDSITDAFISCEPSGKITYINKRAESLLQLQEKYTLGRILWKELSPQLSVELRTHIATALERQEVAKHDLKWGEKAWVRVHIYPSSDGASLYMNDITAEKEVSQRRDEFISIASHELKTPVTSIKAFSQLLSLQMKQVTDEKPIYLLAKMNEQIDKLTQLVNDLLDVGRIQSGRLALRKETFDMNELVNETVMAVRETAKQRSITVEGSISQILSGDKNRIAEVLVNLLTNAIKYSAPDKKIRVTLQQTQGKVIVSVKDNGVGIPTDLQKNLFRRFYRISYSGTGEHSGLGLGLYIVRNIIKQHGGDVWVESASGKGSTFSFSLPL